MIVNTATLLLQVWRLWEPCVQTLLSRRLVPEHPLLFMLPLLATQQAGARGGSGSSAGGSCGGGGGGWGISPALQW